MFVKAMITSGRDVNIGYVISRNVNIQKQTINHTSVFSAFAPTLRRDHCFEGSTAEVTWALPRPFAVSH